MPYAKQPKNVCFTRFWRKLSDDVEFSLCFAFGSSFSFSFCFLVDLKLEMNEIDDFSNSSKDSD